VEQRQKVTQGLMQACDEMNATCCQSMDAVVESASALTKGCEEISRNFGNWMQEQMARTLKTGKTMMSVKSMQEIADVQAEFMKDCFDQWMISTGQMSKISARVTQEALAPVAKHARGVMGKVTKSGKAA
jgi:phasin family protein